MCERSWHLNANGNLLEVIVKKEVDVRVATRLDALGEVLLVQSNRLQRAADVHTKATHQTLSVQAVCQLLQLCSNEVVKACCRFFF